MPEVTVDQAMHIAAQLENAGRLAEAEKICHQILQNFPQHPQAMMQLSILLAKSSKYEPAIDLMKQLIAQHPNAAPLHCNLGAFYRGLDKLDEAAAAFKRATEIDPTLAEAHYNLGVVHGKKLQWADAAVCYQKAITLQPNNADFHNNLGGALLKSQRLDEAIAAFRRALQLRPQFADVLNNLAAAYKEKQLLAEAADTYRKCLAIAPNNPDAHVNLASVLHMQGRCDDALAAAAKALQLKPDHAEAHNTRGLILRSLRRPEEAAAAFRKAIDLAPTKPSPHNNLGLVLGELGQLDEAIRALERAIALDPNCAEAHSNLGRNYKEQGRLDETLASFDRAMALAPTDATYHGNRLYTLYFHESFTGEAIAAEHREWNRRHAAHLQNEIPEHRNDRSPNRRLKIGYVSPDLRFHASCCFMLPLLQNHDPSQVEITCYAGVAAPDAMTKRMQSLVHHWRNTMGQSDAQLAQTIHADQIDILVDLNLHMANSRLLTFARKPAPIQVTWLGYAGTTGLSTVDYRLTDPHLDPPEHNSHYTETSIRLPTCFWCYKPMAEAPTPGPLPALTANHITFGAFNHFSKVSASALDLWKQILAAIPNSRLILHCPQGDHRQRILDNFAQAEGGGISRDRLELVGTTSLDGYYRQFQRVDILLDPFPYAGGTTSCDALWMGVPVITLGGGAGQTAVGRGGVSLLTNLNMPEWIAHSKDDYREIAIRMSSDLNNLAAIRKNLRPRMQASPLMDGKRFAKEVEAAYRHMWHHWCDHASRVTP